MTDVSLNEGSDGRPPEAQAELLTLVTRLSGPPDFWDRPDGDFGPLTHLYDLDPAERAEANSHYRLGSKALDRHELATAADWLGRAASAGHPGALFRLTLVVLRAGADWEDEAWFLIEEAARHGHGDAAALLAEARSDRVVPAVREPVQDPVFLAEIRRALDAPAHQPPAHQPPVRQPSVPQASLPQPSTPASAAPQPPVRQTPAGPMPAHPAPALRTTGGAESPPTANSLPTAKPLATAELPTGPATPEDSADPAPYPRRGLVLVPPPVLPRDYGPAPRPEAVPDLERPRLTALAGGLTLDVPDLGPAPARTAGTGGGHRLVLGAAPAPAPPSTPLPGAARAPGGGGEQWWAASALRPAILTDMARHSNAPAVVPARWQLTQRARDMLMLIHTSDGIDTRALARRARMPVDDAARMLAWLAREHFVESRDTVHFAGPLLSLAVGGDPARALLTESLAGLRDELGAAVYISSYADGEIAVRASSSSATAPPVDEWAPFPDTAHASAVGKSLLAQLDFTARMDHLTRHPSVALTERTITNRRALIETLDAPGPHAAQFDLLEYSDQDLCVAYSLGLPGRASSIALSLPAGQHKRLVAAAETLSRRATGLLLVNLLAEQTPATSAPAPRAPGAQSKNVGFREVG
ncbi:IclR family transcriptional regulator C-terminal domain-containing protein [Streptomyces sp. NPDC090025]|uniref:IclR family transcriptional regulator domain-containing protein n=1 Tax=Streptomyces sp. NPDC090025 TaxID=3365922 RepID=UPI0038335E79